MAEVLKSCFISNDIVSIGARPLAPIATPVPTPQLEIEEAYRKGLEQGLKEGQAHAYTQLKNRETTINELINSIPTAIENHRMRMSMEIADIILLIIQRFFINQQHNKEEIISQITHTLEQLNQKQNIELRLHPNDITLLQQSELNVQLKPYKNLRIIPDETLRLGGCIIHSEHGVFNASIERQIDNLKQVLLKIKNGTLEN